MSPFDPYSDEDDALGLRGTFTVVGKVTPAARRCAETMIELHREELEAYRKKLLRQAFLWGTGALPRKLYRAPASRSVTLLEAVDLALGVSP